MIYSCELTSIINVKYFNTERKITHEKIKDLRRLNPPYKHKIMREIGGLPFFYARGFGLNFSEYVINDFGSNIISLDNVLIDNNDYLFFEHPINKFAEKFIKEKKHELENGVLSNETINSSYKLIDKNIYSDEKKFNVELMSLTGKYKSSILENLINTSKDNYYQTIEFLNYFKNMYKKQNTQFDSNNEFFVLSFKDNIWNYVYFEFNKKEHNLGFLLRLTDSEHTNKKVSSSSVISLAGFCESQYWFNKFKESVLNEDFDNNSFYKDFIYCFSDIFNKEDV
jgi:hypothetical protein